MTGTVTVTPAVIDWNSDASPLFLAQMFTLSAGTGSFVGENGQNTVDDLTLASEPIGVLFASDPFISFDVVPGLPDLLIDFIYPGTGGSAGCTLLPPAVGQTCTPPNPGGSPFTFTNDNPPGAIQSSAQWVFTGVSSDGKSDWTGDFTAQFSTPFQTVLADFASTGHITASYSGVVTVTVIPEPASFVMLGLGLGAILATRKYARR